MNNIIFKNYLTNEISKTYEDVVSITMIRNKESITYNSLPELLQEAKYVNADRFLILHENGDAVKVFSPWLPYLIR